MRSDCRVQPLSIQGQEMAAKRGGRGWYRTSDPCGVKTGVPANCGQFFRFPLSCVPGSFPFGSVCVLSQSRNRTCGPCPCVPALFRVPAVMGGRA